MTGRRRRWLVVSGAVAGGVLAAATVCAVLGLWLFYGTLGEWVIRDRVLPKVATKLGRRVVIDSIEVDHGSARFRGVTVYGPSGEEEDVFAEVAQVSVEFDFWSSLLGDVDIGSIEIEGPRVGLLRRRDGTTNVDDVLERVRGDRSKAGDEPEPSSRPALSLEHVAVTDGRIEARDEEFGLTLVAYELGAELGDDGIMRIDVGEAAVLSRIGPHAKFRRASLSFELAAPKRSVELDVGDGVATLWKGMELTGITGSVKRIDKNKRLELDLKGAYGGLEGTLWHAAGWLVPERQAGEVELRADRFAFSKLAPVLADNPYILDYDETAMDVSIKITADERQISVAGDVGVSGLNLFHPMMSAEPIRDFSTRANLHASFDRERSALSVSELKVASAGVEYQFSGEYLLAGGLEVSGGSERRLHPRVNGRLVVPTVPCQQVLASIPQGFVPKLNGFELTGSFDADFRVAIDWADLQATVLEGGVNLDNCQVVRAPKQFSVKRLKGSFEHKILIGEDTWETIVLGPENPDFVPLIDVSPYLVRSFMTTEDSRFYRHRGFITQEFRTALIRDLEAGYFKYGASSITMQTVKNVFLHREKTLSRKFQELFLTWYVETKLSKDRILEIYVNAIEYGPGLYGIKPAAHVYFDKHPRNLTPVEAAFFSTLLPAPRRRYRQFCRDKLSPWTENKISRILQLMFDRDRLTEEELMLAQVTPLLFSASKGSLCGRSGYAGRRSKRN